MKASRREFLLLGVLSVGGCSTLQGLSLHPQHPDEPIKESKIEIRLVGDLAVPHGMFPVALEAVGMVSDLKGTGSDPKPSPQRDVLLAAMQIRGVKSPNTLLASKNVSLVMVRGLVRPGIQKGDRFDIEIRVPSQSETTSLRGGYLLQTELKEMAVMEDNVVHGSHPYALAEGPVLVDPSADPKNNRVMSCRGRVLGGAVALKSRPLALLLKNKEYQTVFHAARIESAVNRRFHTFEKGIKTGVARAKDNQYVHLSVHPRYKDNIQRYMAVVRSIALHESETERMERVALLARQLLDPITSSRAALQLEAIGKSGIEVLQKGLASPDPEVRFYCAESLAYLDDSRAAEPLAEAARNTPAFRVFALTALSAMNDFSSTEKLRDLIQMPSAETRYGAFRALWAMNPNEPSIRGEQLGGQFSFHLVDVASQPMIHVTRSRRPEIILFGRDQRFQGPFALEAGNRIMVTSKGGDEVTISKFTVSEADQKRVVSNHLEEVIRTIVELGGTYPDVVQALQQAKATGALSNRFEVDALPEAGRPYERIARDGPKKNKNEAATSGPVANSPVPDLYYKGGEAKASADEDSAKRSAKKKPGEDEKDEDSEQKPGPIKAFFAKIRGSSEEKSEEK